MRKIIEETEASNYDDLVLKNQIKKIESTDEAISQIANLLARTKGIKGILVASLSGKTACLVSRYRPELPIFVATDHKRIQRQVNLSWGTVPFILPSCRSLEELVERSIGYLKKEKGIKRGDKLILVAGEPVGISGMVNLVEIKTIK